MPVYRNISLSFWTDSKVDDDFTPEDKYFYLYLLTNPHTTISGCYEVSMKQMCRETGYNEDSVTRLLDRMEHQHGVVQYSRDTKEVLIVNWAKYNWTTSEKMLSGVMTAAHSIKCPEFRAFIAKKLKEKELKLVIDLKPALTFEQLDQRVLRDFEENINKQFKNAIQKNNYFEKIENNFFHKICWLFCENSF